MEGCWRYLVGCFARNCLFYIYIVKLRHLVIGSLAAAIADAKNNNLLPFLAVALPLAPSFQWQNAYVVSPIILDKKNTRFPKGSAYNKYTRFGRHAFSWSDHRLIARSRAGSLL